MTQSRNSSPAIVVDYRLSLANVYAAPIAFSLQQYSPLSFPCLVQHASRPHARSDPLWLPSCKGRYLGALRKPCTRRHSEPCAGPA